MLMVLVRYGVSQYTCHDFLDIVFILSFIPPMVMKTKREDISMTHIAKFDVSAAQRMMRKGTVVGFVDPQFTQTVQIGYDVIAQIPTNKKPRCAIFSSVRSKEEIIRQLLCGVSGVSADKLDQGRVEADEWSTLLTSANCLSDTPLFVQGDLTNINEVEPSIEKCGQKFDLIVIEGKADFYDTPVLKQIATNCNVAIFAAIEKAPSNGFDEVVNVG